MNKIMTLLLILLFCVSGLGAFAQLSAPTITGITSICAGTTATVTASGQSGATFRWWSAATGGSQLATTAAYTTPNQDTAGVYHFYVEQIAGGLVSLRTDVAVTVKVLPLVTITANTNTVCPGVSATLTARGANSYTWSPGGDTTAIIIVSPSGNTTYTVTGTTNGCSTTADVAINRYQVEVSPRIVSYCGSPVILTASGGGAFSWSPGGASTGTLSVAPSVTTTYIVTGSLGGCRLSDTAVVNVPPVAVQVTAGPGAGVTEGSIVHLTATTNTGINSNWETSQSNYGYNTGTSAYAVPTENTTYTITVTDAYGCPATSSTAISVARLPAVTGTLQLCPGSSTTLTATGTGPFTWYDTAAGGTALYTGVSYVTPALLVSTSYWVADNGGPRKEVKIYVPSANALPATVAFPAIICAGDSSRLSAAGYPGVVSWYDAPTGGNLIGISTPATSVPVGPKLTTTYYAEGAAYQSLATFNATGGVQTWTVPDGITSINIIANGAKSFGNGGRVQTTMNVVPGQVLYLYLGTSSGWNGGGLGLNFFGTVWTAAGGATDIRINGQELVNRVVVAGGSGSLYAISNTGFYGTNGLAGDGGGLTGQDGAIINAGYIGYMYSYKGFGGSQSKGGNRGDGGTGGAFGYGAGGSYFQGCGGGGWYGGGSSGQVNVGGGGGSSYTNPQLCQNVVHTQGVNNGQGQLTISYGVTCAGITSTRVPVVVTVPASFKPAASATAALPCVGSPLVLTAPGFAPSGEVGAFSGGQIQSGNSGTAAITTAANDFTLDFWVKPTDSITLITPAVNTTAGTTGQRFAVYPMQSGNDAGAGISVGKNGIQVCEHGNSYLPVVLSFKGIIPDSVFTHVAVVYTAKTPALYINGSQVTTGLTSTRPNVYPSIGSGGTGGYGSFKGQLDNVRIWANALTQTEIRAILSRSDTVLPGKTLAARYSFDGGSLTDDRGVPAKASWSALASAPRQDYRTYNWATSNAVVPNSYNESQTVTMQSYPLDTRPWYLVKVAGGGCTSLPGDTLFPVIGNTPTATVTGPAFACQGIDTTVVLQGFNAKAPYTFSYTLNGGPTQTVSTVAQRIRYIRLRQNAADCFHLSELRAIDYYTGVNVALGKTVTASSSVATDPAGNLTDGNDGTKWHSVNCQTAGEYIEVDLGAAYRLDNIQIVNRQDCCWDRAANLQLTLKDSAGNRVSSRTIDAYQGINGGYSSRWPTEVVSLPLPVAASGTYQYTLQRVTSDLGCSSLQSGSMTATVLTPVAPVVTLAASTATELCTGTAVTFSPALTDTLAPSYTWYRNGTQVATSSTYSIPNIAARDSIALIVINTRGCAGPASAAYLKMRINTPLTDSIIGSSCGANPVQARVSNTPYQLEWKNGVALVATNMVSWSGAVTSITSVANPAHPFVDTAGNVYIAEAGAHRITRWAPGATTGVVVAGGNGSGTAANQLNSPSGVYVAANGDVYVADLGNHRIQRWPAGAVSGTTVAGNGNAGATAAQLSSPNDITLDASGSMYISDYGNHRIQRWAPGAVRGRTVAGSSSGVSGTGTASLNHPYGVAVDKFGAVIIADQGNHRIVKWAANADTGTVILGNGTAGSGAAQLNTPTGVAVDGAGNVYVSDGGNHRVQRRNPAGTSTVTIAGTGTAGAGTTQLSGPAGLTLTRTGKLCVSDRGNNRVQVYMPLTDTVYTPVSSGSHTVIATSFDGCPSVSPAHIISTPAINVVSALAVCEGLDTALVVSGMNAVSPYTFSYSINGGAPRTVNATIRKVRYMRLTQNMSNFLQVAELRAFDATGTNVAINKPISSAYPQYSAGFPASGINDGNLNTSYKSGPLSGSFAGGYAEIDLGQEYTLDHVEVYIPYANAIYYQYVKNLTLAFKDNSGVEVSTQQIDAAPTNSLPRLTSWRIPQAASNIALLPVATGTPGLQTYTFTAVGGDNCSATINTAVAVTVKPKAAISGLPASLQICTGMPLTLTATVAGASAYQWLKNGTPVAGATSASYSKSGVTNTDNGRYQLTSVAANGCTDSSAQVSVTTIPAPVAAITGTTTVCQDAPVQALAVSGINGVSPYRFSYQINGGAVQTAAAPAQLVRYVRLTQNQADWANIAEVQAIEAGTGANVALNKPATSSTAGSGSPASMINDGSTADGNFWHSLYPDVGEYVEIDLGSPGYSLSEVKITNRADCCGDRLRDLQLVMKDNSGVQLSTVPINVYGMQDNLLTASFPVVTAGTATLSVPSATPGVFTYKITSVSAGGCVSTPDDSAVVTINAKASFFTQPPAALQVCTPTPLVLSATASAAASYQWRKAGVAIAGATSASYVKPVTAAADAGDYSVIALNAAGCNDTSTISTVTAGTLASLPAAAAAPAGTTLLQADGMTLLYTSAACEPIASVTDAAGGNVLGTVSTMVVKDAVVNTYNGQPYLQRHFDISPASNGPATVTLYATQDEFNTFNTWLAGNGNSYPKLPTGPGDAAGIANISVSQFHGLRSAGTTGPGGQYLAAGRELIPNSAIATSWNGSYWTMRFPVTGFSGFFITTGTAIPLPIRLSNIRARNLGAHNLVEWTSVSEETGDYYELERSTDGSQFFRISTVKGASPMGSDYRFTDEHPVPGLNYYRLKLRSAGSGAGTYTRIVTARVAETGGFGIAAYPNPVSDLLTLQINGMVSGKGDLTLSDLTGRVVTRMEVKSALQTMPMGNIAAGVYMLRYTDAGHTVSLKVTKK